MWSFPTRSRLDNCRRFIKAWEDTKASSPVYVRLDNDDPVLNELLALNWPKEFLINTGSRVKSSKAMQEMFIKYPNEPWYGMLADDLIPRTLYWDRELIQAADTHNIVYADDLHEKKIRICHPCIGGDLVRFVGFLGLPVVEHFGTDTIWEQIHHCLGRQGKLEHVILEHAHFNFGQAPVDDTYHGSQAIRQDDKRAYKAWMNENFNNLLDRISQRYGWERVRERSGW